MGRWSAERVLSERQRGVWSEVAREGWGAVRRRGRGLIDYWRAELLKQDVHIDERSGAA